MEFKGTKGNWLSVQRNRVIYITNKDMVLVCELDFTPTDGFFQPIPEAVLFNSKLITSAPDILFALKDLVKYCEENNVGAELELAKDAINKATQIN